MLGINIYCVCVCFIITGKHFGELALIDDAPRKATVTATTPTVQCWTLDRANFLNLFGSMNDAVKESMGITMLRCVITGF